MHKPRRLRTTSCNNCEITGLHTVTQRVCQGRMRPVAKPPPVRCLRPRRIGAGALGAAMPTNRGRGWEAARSGRQRRAEADLEHTAIEAAFQHSQTVSWAANDKHVAAVLCGMHILLLRKTGSSGPSGSFLRMCMALAALALPALASLAGPAWYRAGSHRCWVVAATRLGTSLLLIQTRDLAATGTFDSVTTLGQGLRKVLGGCRVIPLVIMAHAYPLPLHWLMWVQLAAVARAAVESRSHLCHMPQLASPVVKQLVLRMAGAVRHARIMDWAFGFVPPDWAAQAEAVGESGWCFMLAFWLQMVLGYGLPLLLRWLLTERARRAFYKARCHRVACNLCSTLPGSSLLGTALATVGVYMLFALLSWDVLFANQLMAHAYSHE